MSDEPASNRSAHVENQLSATLEADEAVLARARELSLRRGQPPAQVPGYHLVRSLGEGAFGTVWLAHEHSTGKVVAIKFYTQRRSLDWSLLTREVEKLAVLYTSRHIVGLLHVGWDADPPYYVMEYLAGGSLAQRLEEGPLSPAETVRIARDVLMGLVHAHGAGILHCDLKPANILLDSQHQARLADFGQSRLSHERDHALGTLYYMAPEQADLKANPDARWDVYALGAVLFQALTGQVPHRTPERDRELAQAGHIDERLKLYRDWLGHSPVPQAHARVPGVDKRLAEIISRCLQSDPDLRYPNAQAVLDALAIRERDRSAQPLLLLGILAPVLLILGLGTIANRATSDAIGDAQESLQQRALEANRITVTILARSIEHELEDRTAELKKAAGEERLPQVILDEENLPWEERHQLRRLLGEWKTRVDRDRAAIGLPSDQSWFLVNAKGKQIFRHPEADTIDHVYNFRDYFHGQQQDYPKDRVPADVRPIRAPYVSKVYKSEADEDYRVAITVPVWDKSQQNVVGVLGRSVQLSHLLQAYKSQIESSVDGQVTRTIALFDGHATKGKNAAEFQLLDHPWFTDQRGGQGVRVGNAPLRLTGKTAQKLQELEERESQGTPDPWVWSIDYQDPVSALAADQYGGEWLAVFAPVGETNWIATVQERRGSVLQPVEEMAHRLHSYLQWGLATCGALIAVLWYFIYYSLRQQGRTSQEALPQNHGRLLSVSGKSYYPKSEDLP